MSVGGSPNFITLLHGGPISRGALVPLILVLYRTMCAHGQHKAEVVEALRRAKFKFREAGEIIRLVAPVCLSVCPSADTLTSEYLSNCSFSPLTPVVNFL